MPTYTGQGIVSVDINLEKGKKPSSVLIPVFLVTWNSSQDSSGSPSPVFCLALCPFQVVFL